MWGGRDAIGTRSKPRNGVYHVFTWWCWSRLGESARVADVRRGCGLEAHALFDPMNSGQAADPSDEPVASTPALAGLLRVMPCLHRNLSSQSGGALGFLSVSCWRYERRTDATGGLLPAVQCDPRNPRRRNVLSLLWMPVARDDRLDSTALVQPASHSCLQTLGDDLRRSRPRIEHDRAPARSSTTLESRAWFRSRYLGKTKT